MAKTKSGGSTKLGRDSIGKRLGIKRQHGQAVKIGEVLIRQRGTKYLPGANVKRGKDDTLYSIKNGIVEFISKKKICFDGNARSVKVINVVISL